ncbi:MAG: 2-polyprenylphenol 6-hydroxylase [Alphaproteobacteria bacterium]|nr:2-polyprenylphenol 6-hydroxylase [Alphaproteobacteria bacterium]
MFRAVTNLSRLAGAALILARHDALFPLDRIGFAGPVAAAIRLVARMPGLRHETRDLRPGERLAQALTELGPSFIKFGQSLATRADLIGEDIATDLSRLQDRLEPFPADHARDIVAAELDRPLDEVFSSFEDQPVAAASIAQVHLATTTEGAPVAVKVLRPGIEAEFARDLDLLGWLAEQIERNRPELRRLKPREVVRTFAQIVATEMDLRLEAAAAAELGENFAGDDKFIIPAVDWQRTARRVLTLERVGGIPIDEREALIAAGIDPDEVLKTASRVFFLQVFRDGFFHADLHPGNLFVSPEGALQAVDFGIMGRLDLATRCYLGEMLLGFLEGDYGRVADVHFRAGYVPANQSRDMFMQACRSIGQPILGLPMSQISVARLLAQLFAVTETFQMEAQPQLLLLQKTMMVAEGVGRRLNPDVNMWELSRPLIEDWMRENLGPEARMLKTAREMMAGIERLPGFVANVEKLAAMVAEKGNKPRPGVLAELLARDDGDRPAARGGAAAQWWIAGLLVAILITLILKSF